MTKAMLRFSALNIAPQAARHRPLTWLLLLASAAVLCASILPLASSLLALEEARARRITLDRAGTRLKDIARQERSGIATAAAHARDKANGQYRAMIQMSWNGVFGALENAAQSVNGGASIVSMIPKHVSRDDITIDLSALAASLPGMLAYVEALKGAPTVRTVDLISHQPDPKTSPDAVRFQIIVRFDPVTIVDSSAYPASVAMAPAGAAPK